MNPNEQQGQTDPIATQPQVAVPEQLGRPQVAQPQPVQPLAPQQPSIDPAVSGAVPNESVSTALPQASPAPAKAPEATPTNEQQSSDDILISWTANEYIHQEKGVMWFAIFGVIIAALLVYSVWAQQWVLGILVIVVAAVIVVYSRRLPRELTYSLNDSGLLADGKLYEYSNFKSFGVVKDGEEFSIVLIPTQRLQPSVTVYFPEEIGEDIVDIFGDVLPMKDLKLDAVDRLVRLLRL